MARVAVLAATGALMAQVAGAQRPASPPADTTTSAFIGVNVIPMDSERMLRDQTVVVVGGRLTQIGPRTAVTVPRGARRIDAAGKFLMPGLIDTHVHLPPYQAESLGRLPAVLSLLIANGVTTARSMVGHPSHLHLRDAVARGALFSPSVVIAAPQITGPKVEGFFAQYRVVTADEARQRVRAAKENGFDFVKITFGFTPEIYDAVAGAARDAGLPLSGHVTPGVSFDQVLRARQQIEHLDPYLEATVSPSAPIRSMGSQANPGAIVRHIDADAIRRVARATRDAGIANSPTLSLFQVAFIRDAIPLDSLTTWPDFAYFTPQAREAMINGRANFWTNAAAPADERLLYDRFRNEMTKALADADALLMVGSDSPQSFHMVGFAVHHELAALVAAGLTPFQALSAATRSPATFLGARDMGTIAVGNRADLLLLDSNPLDSIVAASKPAGVMLVGRWIPASEIAELLLRARP